MWHSHAVADFSTTDFAEQSTLKHVAIIMDGKRRWARQRGLPALDGHRAGVERVIDLLRAFEKTRVETLTLFAFSAANWRRCEREVNHLMRLAEQALRRFSPRCQRDGIRVEIVGRKDRLPEALQRGIDQVVRNTAGGDRCLRIALDYSSREAIVDAARRMDAEGGADNFADALGCKHDVDLLIRTGKEQRLSDFLLWECAFAELYFPDLYWPDFTPEALWEAMDWFQQRQRRFGA